jgi:dihydrofolate synthase/folylpolyglutamate synthase
LNLSLLGEHQQLNAGVALAVVRQLRPLLPVPDDAVMRGLASTIWPGRLQLVATPRGRILLDGAHNPDGVEVLARALQRHFPNEPPSMILGFFQDKPWREMLAELLPLARRVWFAPVQSERTIDPADALRFCREMFPALECHQAANLASALDAALGPGLALVTGSLFFVGEALELLGQNGGLRPERELNEWDAAKTKSG